MKKKTISTLAAVVLLGALFGTTHAQAQCSANQVKLHLDQNRIHITPPEAKCVTVPGSFTIDVKSPGSTVDPAVGEVTVHEKPSSDLTISGTNDPDPDVVVVNVSGTAGGSHGYVVEIAGHGMLDPEVRVVTRFAAMEAQVRAAESLLDEELGLSLQDFEELLREYRNQQME